MKIAHVLGLGIGLSLLCATEVAAAQRVVVVTTRAAPDFAPQSQESRIGLEFDWLHTSPFPGTINVLTWDLFAQIRLTPRLFLDADIPWAYAAIPPAADRGVFGNPMVGLHFADSISDTVHWFIGGGLTIPVLADPSNAGFAAALYTSRLRAYSEQYRFYPAVFPLLFRGGIEITAAPFFGRFDLAPTLLVALNDRIRTRVAIDQGNEVGLRARFGFLGGLRLQGNFILTSDTPDDDNVQLAMEPFLGYESDTQGAFVRFGVLFALDENLGFGFNRGKDAIIRFSVGGKW